MKHICSNDQEQNNIHGVWGNEVKLMMNHAPSGSEPVTQ